MTLIYYYFVSYFKNTSLYSKLQADKNQWYKTTTTNKALDMVEFALIKNFSMNSYIQLTFEYKCL